MTAGPCDTARVDPVERKIQEAVARGDFDGLPGAGKPLDLSDAGDPDWWVKRFMDREGLRLADALPPLFTLRQQAASFPESLAGLPDEDAVRAELHAYNRRVRDEILRTVTGAGSPVIAHAVDVEAVVEQWRQLRAARAAAPVSDEPVPPAPTPWWRRLRRPR